MTLVDPDAIAFGSVDDDLAERLARAHGWDGETELSEQVPVRLAEFGPRKWTPSDDWGGASIDDLYALYHTMYTTGIYGTLQRWVARNGAWYLEEETWPPKPVYVRGDSAKARPRKRQWDRPFYDNRPTERPKAGRPKRRRK